MLLWPSNRLTRWLEKTLRKMARLEKNARILRLFAYLRLATSFCACVFESVMLAPVVAKLRPAGGPWSDPGSLETELPPIRVGLK